jgi:hypothetical protein
MRTAWRRQLSYSNVVATLALFVALGGASYAATTLAPDTVGTMQLRPKSVTVSKLAFSLGVSTRESMGTVTLNTGSCPPQAACPVAISPKLVSTSLTLPKPSDVLLIGSGQFNLASLGAPANVNLALTSSAVEVVGGGSTQPVESITGTSVSIERVVSSRAGRQMFSLTASASGETPDVSVSGDDFQITAIVLPQTATP